MLDRFRERIRPGGSQTASRQARRVTRREREERQQRLLYLAAGIAGAVVIVALIVGAAYQYYFYPHGTIASVNGTDIQRRDYWKVRGLQLRQNLAQISQQYQITSADQRPQLEQQAAEIQAELDDLRGADLAEDTLSAMVDNLIVLQNIDDMGIEITQADMDEFVTEQFAPAPLSSPTPTPEIDSTAAAWATGTAEANQAASTATVEAAQTAAAASPTAEETGTAEASETTEPTASTEAGAEATETPASEATEATGAETTPATDEAGTPDASPAASPTPSPTIAPDDARATAVSRFDQYKSNYLEPSDMSRSDYERLIVKPELARTRVQEQLESQVPQRAEQIHAAHILVATEEAANAVEERLKNGEDFAEVAKEVSTDTSTAPNGGDLGWFPRGVMVAPFEEAAFALQPGEVSAPVQSSFGWHVIKVFEHEDDRPLTLEMMQSLKSRAYSDWIQARRNESDISSDIPLTTLQREQNQANNSTFQAPADAPLPPTATPAPLPTEDTGTPTQ